MHKSTKKSVMDELIKIRGNSIKIKCLKYVVKHVFSII